MVEGGTAHGYGTITKINLLCLWGAPKEQGGEVAGLGGGRAKGGVLLPPGVGLLLPLLE